MKKILVNIFALALMFTIMASSLVSHGAAVTDLSIKYGKTTIDAKVLDDLTNSEVDQTTVWRDGTVEMKDGKALGKSTVIVDCYKISVPNADANKEMYRSAKYIGYEIDNASDGSIYYCFQGKVDGDSAILTPFGEKDIILVDMNGVVQDVTLTSAPSVYERYAFMIPKGFKGYVLIPTSSITKMTDLNTPIWGATTVIDGIAFHASTGQSTTPAADAKNIEFYIDNFFVVSNDLPDPNATEPETNPTTSDTFVLLPLAVLFMAIMLFIKESKMRYSL